MLLADGGGAAPLAEALVEEAKRPTRRDEKALPVVQLPRDDQLPRTALPPRALLLGVCL